MNQSYKSFLGCMLLLLIAGTASNVQGQCVPKLSNFSTWTRTGGPSGGSNTYAVNSVFKYTNVSTGVDAIVTIVGSNRATVLNIDQTSGGYTQAWQPIINVKPQSGNPAWVEFKIDFKSRAANADTTIPCIAMGIVDNDGGSTYREMIGVKGFTNYQITTGSNLTVTAGNPWYLVNGINTSYSNIDTINKAAMAQVNFIFVKTLNIRLGATRISGTPDEDRQFSLYFQRFGGLSVIQLPVDLTRFDAVKKSNQVELKWQTATEENNNFFEIERQNANSDEPFVKIGEVRGQGTSSSLSNYQFTDEGVTPGIYTYRLKQVDYNGKTSYSMARTVVTTADAMDMNAYPNPFNEQFTLSVDLSENSQAGIKVVDVLGKTVYTMNPQLNEGHNNIDIPTADLAPGLYYAVIELNNEVRTFQLQKAGK